MEEIRREISNIRVDVAVLKTDVKHICDEIAPIGQMNTNISLLKDKLGTLVWFTGSILVIIIASFIVWLIKMD